MTLVSDIIASLGDHPSEVIQLDQLPWDESILYGKHAQFKHPEQVSVWELYSELSPEYQGRHRDDGWYDRQCGEPMVMWSAFSESFIRVNMDGHTEIR